MDRYPGTGGKNLVNVFFSNVNTQEGDRGTVHTQERMLSPHRKNSWTFGKETLN